MFCIGLYLCCNQELTKGCQPISSTSKNIIPARDTVAGDATARSSTYAFNTDGFVGQAISADDIDLVIFGDGSNRISGISPKPMSELVCLMDV